MGTEVFELGKNCRIHPSVQIDCAHFEVGDFTIINEGVKIQCHTFKAGTWLYMDRGVEVGRGGSSAPNSRVSIGDHVGIFNDAILNPSSPITIGDNVGIGSETMIWTHGAWLDPLKGFPSDFGHVEIGSDVWIPSRCTVLPNVTIGDNCVIGINSVVNRDIPDGSFAAGTPCKVIEKDAYPKILLYDEKFKLIIDILRRWKSNLDDKLGDNTLDNIKYGYHADKETIELIARSKKMTFHLNDRTVTGILNDIGEDLRDFLRRNGIKFYTDKHFKSIAYGADEDSIF